MSRKATTAIVSVLLSAVISTSTFAAVGKIDGSFAVGQDGSANYSIPIWTPPGPHGLQPSVALQYNSESGNSELGVGWNITGLPSITVCNMAVGWDIVNQAAALGNQHGVRFCLNGKRLRVTNGTWQNGYDIAGSVYQTDIADFSRISVMGMQQGMPTSFVAEGNDGLTYEYGNSADSRLTVPSGYAYEWRLNRVRDRNGNSYVINYMPTTLGAVVSSISWSPTAAGGTSYQYQMTFHYSVKTNTADQVSYANFGYNFNNQYRLDSITIGYSATGASYSVIRQYLLGYETSSVTSLSRLKQIQECAATTSDCLASTSFTYQNGQLGASSTPSGSFSASSGLLKNKYDVNGDGKSDLIFPSGSTWKVAFSTGSGFGSPADTGIPTSVTPLIDRFLSANKDSFLFNSGGTWRYVGFNGTSFVGASTGIAVPTGTVAPFSTDNNGDGLADLTWVDSSYNLMIRLNTTTGSASVPSFGSAYVALTAVGNSTSTNVFAPGYCAGTRHCDINGDGATELGMVYVSLSCWDRGCTATATYMDLLSDGAGGYSRASGVDVTGNSSAASYWGMNFNKDKCIDKLMKGIGLYVSGCGTTAGTLVSIPAATPVMVMDWNGDGRTDLVVANGSTLGVYLSTGNLTTPFSSLIQTSIPYSSSNTYFAFDVDGDGLDDIAVVSSTGALTYYTHTSATAGFSSAGYDSQTPDLLIGIDDGFGNSIAPAYISTAHSNYTRGPDDVALPVIAVGQVTYSDQGANYFVTYNYYGWLGSGRGPYGSNLNFQQITTVDSRDGVLTHTTYAIVYPNTGLIIAINEEQGDGTLISHTSNTLETLANETLDGTQYSDRFFPRIASGTVEQYEVGGTKNGQLITTTSSTYSYDGYGNLTSSIVKTTDNDSNSPKVNQWWKVTTTNTPDVDTNTSADVASWCLPLLDKTVVQYTASDGSATVTRTKSFVPDITNCRLHQIITEPNSNRYQLTDTLAYDGFGNVSADTTTGDNIATRTTTIDWGATGQFPMHVWNALNQETSFGYDLSKGVMTSQTDANNLTTSWPNPDGFGRRTREARPDGTYTDFSYHYCSDTPGVCPSPTDLQYWVDQIDRDTSGNALHETRSVFNGDDLLRFVLDQNLDGSFAYKLHRGYDSFHRLTLEYVPGTAESAPYHLYSLDLLGRIVDDSLRDSSGAEISHSSAIYEGRTATQTDANGKETTKVMDVMGRMINSIDAKGYAQTFSYDAYGSMTGATDNQGNTLFSAGYEYGIEPLKTSMTDTDLGYRSYTYDALGNVLTTTDAKNQTTTMTYDALSRPWTRSEVEGATTWTWGTSAGSHNIGVLQSVSAPGGYSENYTYDSVGRLNDLRITSDTTYNYDYSYNSTTGLLDTLQYPTSTSSYRLKVKYGYQHGLMNKVSDANAPSTVFWQVNSANAWGEVTQETLGNGIVSSHVYSPNTGWLQSIQAGVSAGAGVQNESYLFDKVGNLQQRQDNNQGLTENFFYDDDYRLTSSTLNGSQNLSVTYDLLGNIMHRSDTGTYNYNSVQTGCSYYTNAQVHAVRNAGGTRYCYDANGNMTYIGSNAISWTSFDKPSIIHNDGNSTQLFYDANHQRWKQIATYGSSSETTIYIGSLMQKTSDISTGTTDYRYYIPAADITVEYVRRSNGTNNTYFATSDHLGSSDVVTCGSDVSGCSAGTVLIRQSFDAFGRRRGSSWGGSPTSADMNNIATTARAGFTGQEMMDNLNLINMNGRIYNPLSGRFISADPHVTDPTDPQNYNRYSYVLNNPLSYTDPTGFDDTKCQVNQKAAQDSRGSETAVQCNPGGNGGGPRNTGGNNSTNNGNLATVFVTGQQKCDAGCQLQGLINFNTMTELDHEDFAKALERGSLASDGFSSLYDVTSITASFVARNSKIGKGARALVTAVATASAAEKVGKIGEKLTLVKSTAQALNGDVKGAIVTITGAQIDRAIGLSAGGVCTVSGAPEIAPGVAGVVSTASGYFGVGDSMAGPLIDSIAQSVQSGEMASSTSQLASLASAL